jgi:outer membrane protein OmpA-like peptidoglycan-associated protein
MGEPSSKNMPTLTTDMSEDLSELRSLLLAPEQTQLDRLQERLDDPVRRTREVSRLLPGALALQQDDPGLTAALTPHVEQALFTSLRRSPQAIVDAIAPIMGPAIRQAITHALQALTQSLNQTVEHSFSLKGFRWRIEAWTTGRPFAEVVLLHTLRYRVEQAFLIHRDTGLLLQHVATETAIVRDQEMVSGMLTAIRNFVHDSFGGQRERDLSSFQVGEFTVWIQQGTNAILAVVIRGTAPETFHDVLQDTLDRIHLTQADALVSFNGDASSFASTQPNLEACLQSQYEAPAQKPSPVLVAIGVLLLLGLLLWGWGSYRDGQRWDTLVDQLKSEPGLVLTTAQDHGGRYDLAGLRDPLATDPTSLIAASGLQADRIHSTWSPYYALDPQFILSRARTILQPPDTVNLALEGEVLVASGAAQKDWAQEARRIAPFVPGVIRYEDKNLRTGSIAQLIEDIERITILFTSNSTVINPGEAKKIQALISAIRELDDMAVQLHQQVTVECRGSVDPSGSELTNRILRKTRAQAVCSALGESGVGSATTLTTETASIRRPENQTTTRSVGFAVTVHPSGSAKAGHP